MSDPSPPPPESPLLLAPPEEPLLLEGPKAAPAKAGPPKRRPYVIAAIALLVLAAIGWYFHHRQAGKAQDANERARDRIPTVGVIEVRPSPSGTDLLLPGSIVSITEASLFARSSGYLRARYVDIGDPVRRGQVLAEIDSPDLDQEVAQGRAAVSQARQQLAQVEGTVVDARARVDLARVVYERAAVLGRDEAVAQQEVDQRRQELDTARASLASNLANAGAARDNIRAAEANARRLAVLQDFEKLRAPFDGVVTARNVDVGALIGGGGSTMGQPGQSSGASSGGTSTTGSSSTASTTGASAASGSGLATAGQSGELFRIGQTDRLRVFVSVPQENASDLVPEHEASVFVQGFPEAFPGRVTRNAKSLDPSARTLLTEVQIDNARHLLMPGMYAQVRFHAPRNDPPLLVPGEAVIARADGLRVAVIEDLRPEDRDRLPKTLPKDDDSKAGDGKDAAKQDAGKPSSGDSGPGRPKKGRAEDASKKGAGSADDDRPRDPSDAKRIRLQPVTIGRDYGTEVEIVRGLRAGATIVANPNDDVVEDALVLPRRRPAATEDKGEKDAPPQGNQSPSRTAPTKGRS